MITTSGTYTFMVEAENAANGVATTHLTFTVAQPPSCRGTSTSQTNSTTEEWRFQPAAAQRPRLGGG